MRTPRDWLEIGARFKHLGDLAAAEAVFRKLTMDAPQMAEAWFDLGWVLDAQGRLNEAARAFAKVIALEPEWQEAWDSMIRALAYTEPRGR